MKRFFAITSIIALTLGLMLVSCQKKEEAAAPAVEKAVEQAAPAEQKPAETGGYGDKIPAAGGYGEEKKAEEKH